MSNINRLQESIFTNYLSKDQSRDVILVQGARQVGKTTLLETVLKNYPKVFSFNLERDTDFLRELDRTQSFDEFNRLMISINRTREFDSPNTILFIDEAQESEKLGSYVRFMKEDWQHVRVILTGSSMSRIFRNTQRIPVGRYRPWLMTPLVFEEYLFATQEKFLQNEYRRITNDFTLYDKLDGGIHNQFLTQLDHYLNVGGLPAVTTAFLNNENWLERRRFILNAQEDDFVRKSTLSDRILFSRGLKGVANYIGMPAKYSHISDSKSLAEKILSELSSWHLVVEVEQKRQSSTSSLLPKRYIYDIGMAQDLREMPFPKLSIVSTSQPSLRTQLGGLFENTLLIQLIHDHTYWGGISGWKSGGTDSSEVDFVLRTESATIPIECKASLKLSRKSWGSVKKYLEITNQKIGFVVSAAPFEVIKSGPYILINVPLYLANLEFFKNCVKQFE